MGYGLLASVVRAWDTTGLIDAVNLQGEGGERESVIVVAVAMNTAVETAHYGEAD